MEHQTIKLELLDQERIRQIYDRHMKQDFPADELRPLEEFLNRVEAGFYECLGLYEEGALRAYGFFTRDRESKYLLLDFLAVCAPYRGGGYGSMFLQQAKAYYHMEQGILLECESEQAARDEQQRLVRRRRIHFYQKNGCRLTTGKTNPFHVEFDLLYLPIQSEQVRVEDTARRLYSLMFPGQAGREVDVWERYARIVRTECWNRDRGQLEEKKNLLTALGFDHARQLPRIVSLVGGGGKTTTMYQLADELAEQGMRVLVTTSTHIRKPEQGQLALVSHVRELERVVWKSRILVAGQPLEATAEKITMPEGLGEEAEMERLLKLADVILIEADGAREKPLKVPAQWEPCIIAQTGLVIACAGLGAVGQTFEEGCFRFADQGSFLGREGSDRIEPEDVALILMDERGSRRQVAGRYYRIVLNQADDAGTVAHAQAVIAALPVTMQECCVVTAYDGKQKKS